MCIRNSLPFDGIDPHSRSIQQYIHNVVIQKVHFIHIQNVPVCRRQNARLKFLFPIFQGVLHVQCPHNPVLRGADRQIDNPHMTDDRFLFRPLTAFLTPEGGIVRIAAEPAAFHLPALSQHLCQGAYRRGFRGSLFPPNQHASQCRIDDVQNQRSLHPLLSHNGAEGIQYLFAHMVSSMLFSSSR